MRELLHTRGLKMTPQRELIIRSFLELGQHISAEELYRKVRSGDAAVGFSTVWRNLKMICDLGLAREVNIGDGITRYDRVTRDPHGHLYCLNCKSFYEIDVAPVVQLLDKAMAKEGFQAGEFKIEVQGWCRQCRDKAPREKPRQTTSGRAKSSRRPSTAQETD